MAERVLLVDPARLSNWLGLGEFENDSPELARASEVIATLSDIVRHEAKQPDWDADFVPGNVAAIVLMVAAETFSNPDNKTSITVEEVTRRWSDGDLFSAAQLSAIRAYQPTPRTGLWTQQFSRGMDAPSIALPQPGRPPLDRPSASAVRAQVADGGKPVILYDGRGY